MLTAIAVTFAALSYAQGPGHQRTHIKDHPRVNQVNKRIDNQEHRINTERKEGEITKAQAHQDRKNLKTVNQEKHDMRKEDNGHLTKTDQKALNQQLNKNSKKISH
jgi:hypothetical protein